MPCANIGHFRYRSPEESGLLAELACDELADITRLTETIDMLAKRIGERVRSAAPSLLGLSGCGELTAAKIVAETAGVDRFKSEGAFARHIGLAPLPHWSGDRSVRFRRTKSGNRQLNMALHRIAVTQIRMHGLGQAYYRGRIADGDTRANALRALKRRLARVVYCRLGTDQHNRRQSSPAGPRRRGSGSGHRSPRRNCWR